MKGRHRTASGKTQQFAALPWRLRSRVEILLVTSRETRRWVLPKGWPMKGRSPAAAAAQEALEEAGVAGHIAKAPVGAYTYFKRMPNGATFACHVDVFPLEVVEERKNWREKAERTRRWFSAEDAASLVEESELGEVISAFAAHARRSGEIISPFEPAG